MPPAETRRLEGILRALPSKELRALIDRMGIRIDPQKRIDVPAQVARALARLADLREPGRLPSSSAELMRRVAEANGSLVVTSLPAGLDVLVRRGILFCRVIDHGVELVLPTAMLVQMKTWEGEDPRSLRALLSEAPFETASAIATHYLGRPSTPPIALSLEPAWEVLGNPAALRSEIERIAHQERRLLDQLEQVGGEVDTQELMDLEREPMRVRGVYGVAAGRRGAAFSLEKRGLLFPLHPNRYVIPTEVAVLIGAERTQERERHRAAIRRHVISEDHLPRRARFACDPAPFTLALAIAMRDSATEVRPGVGTPRSLVSRLAQRFGQPLEATALIIALSRAMGLWESSAIGDAAPPGSLTLGALTVALFDTWKRGGAWDEARAEAEVLRVASAERDPSPAGVLRDMVLDALRDLGEEQWVPHQALISYLENDPRAGGCTRLLERWAERSGVAVPTIEDLATRVLLESLPTLGVVDVGGADLEVLRSSAELASVAVRLTSRGRFLLGRDERTPQDDEEASPQAPGSYEGRASEPCEGRRVVVGSAARVAQVLELSPFCDVAGLGRGLELEVAPAAVARGLAAGISAAEMRSRLEALVDLGPELAAALDQAGTVVGRASLAPATAFLWVEDDVVRDMLRGMSALADMFVDPSPRGGLLVAPGVDPERLVRRCRALGVEIHVEDATVRARPSTVPPPRKSDTKKPVSWRPPSRPRGKR
jgi:hypothetical protein